jgi:hypothetical protein
MGKQIAYRQLVRAGRAPGAFPMQDRRLWERALAATGNGAVRAEEVVEPEIAAMAIGNPELMAEPGMGNARQNKRRRQ